MFCDEFEAQLLQVERLTHVQIADENDDVLDRQVGLIPARAKHGPVRPRDKGSLAIGEIITDRPDKC